MINFIKLKPENIGCDFLDGFHHIQKWSKQYTNVNGTLTLVNVSEMRTWNAEKRVRLSNYLHSVPEKGGAVFGAFYGDQLVGFSAVEYTLKGQRHKYTNLSFLFVDDEYQRKGIGKKLLQHAMDEAKILGADRIFISSVPVKDTVAFYFSLGAILAEEVIEDFIDTEEDIYLEIVL